MKTHFWHRFKNECQGNLIFPQYYIYLYVLCIYIYTHPKLCISHQERKSFCLLFFYCTSRWIKDGGSKRIKKGDIQISKGNSQVGTKQPSEMFLDPKVSAEAWDPVSESWMHVRIHQDIQSITACLHCAKVQVTNVP